MVNKKLFIINCQLPIILRVFVTPCLNPLLPPSRGICNPTMIINGFKIRKYNSFGLQILASGVASSCLHKLL